MNKNQQFICSNTVSACGLTQEPNIFPSKGGNRRWSAVARNAVLSVILCAFVVPTGALAYVESPQVGAFELKFGPYRPAIDSNSKLIGQPYKTIFHNDPMFLTTLELDWQFVHPPGFSIGMGGSFGFMQEYARSMIIDDKGNPTDQVSADYSVLNVMPFAVLAIIRIDVFADNLGVPLVPFVKGGFNWYLWWVHDGGEVPTVNGEKAVGGTLGWQVSTGLMFRLDDLDRMSARTFDNEVGVNHSYLFAEMLWAFVDRFGNNNYLDLSTDTIGKATILFGLALEF